jgi:hypothetical protein
MKFPIDGASVFSGQVWKVVLLLAYQQQQQQQKWLEFTGSLKKK